MFYTVLVSYVDNVSLRVRIAVVEFILKELLRPFQNYKVGLMHMMNTLGQDGDLSTASLRFPLGNE